MSNVKRDETNGITLLLCPFCGGEADTRVERNANVVSVGCPDCNIRTQYMVADDIGIAEAIAAWNTRAERTTTMTTDADSQHWYSCDTCDADGYAATVPNYCPNCGARVVDA